MFQKFSVRMINVLKNNNTIHPIFCNIFKNKRFLFTYFYILVKREKCFNENTKKRYFDNDCDQSYHIQ